MNMYFHELKALRKSTILWALSFSAIVVVFLSLFPSISADAADFKEMLASYPESVRKAVGLELETFFSFLGYYSYTFVYISLCGSVQAMNLGLSVLSKESREKTADFLLTKPVKRSEIYTAKVMAALTSIAATNVVYQAAAWLMASQVAEEGYNRMAFFQISLILFFLQLIFLFLGLMLSVLIKRMKAVLTVSLGVTFGFFILSMLIATGDGGEAKRFLTPFQYFDPLYTISNGWYDTPYLAAGVIIVLFAFAASLYLYWRNDIHSV
ncbi:ABC transporter permease subunit [Bacillus massilinigeriensis]|uniref:ABC transporter permease subunit n=1 Tax=Bacillus mediterraneensis TaxID=1805474 RepID=UPI0008F95F6F|nr:ABC transporter permease subunit [Bacillus mediterraneensis]